MSSVTDIIVTARKKSNDPAQETLREDKDAFNRGASKFIAKLIAFKKGLNGRGSTEFGIKPNRIQDPFSSEIYSTLSSLTEDYKNLAQGAAAVLQEQENYSKTRKKSKKEANMSNSDIEKRASWWGSRFVSNFQFGDPSRRARLSLMSSCVDLIKSFKNLDDSLSSSDEFSIIDSIGNFVEAYNIYSSDILLNAKMIQENSSHYRPSDDEDGPGVDVGDPGVPRRGAGRKPAPGARRGAEPTTEEPAALPTKEEREDLKAIVLDADSCLAACHSAGNVDKGKLQSLVSSITHIYGDVAGEDTDLNAFRKAYDEIKTLYDQALEIGSRVVGKEITSFSEIVGAIPMPKTDPTAPPVVKGACSINLLEIQSAEIKKLAESYFSRIITEKYGALKDDTSKQFISSYIKEAKSIIDGILDHLEERNLNASVLVNKLHRLNEVFLAICNKILKTGQFSLIKASNEYDRARFEISMERSSISRKDRKYVDYSEASTNLQNYRQAIDILRSGIQYMTAINSKLHSYRAFFKSPGSSSRRRPGTRFEL